MTPADETPSAMERELDDTETPDESVADPSALRSGAGRLSRLTTKYRARWRPILLVALTIATVGLAAGLFFLQYRPDRQISDVAAQQAVQAASEGAVSLLSYSSDSLDRDLASAKAHLTGDFLAYYNKFTAEVVAPVVRDKHLVQRAVVIRAAVSQLRPNSAVVLTFVNETVTSADKQDPLVTPSAVRVTLAKVDGTWLISKLDPVG